MSKDGSVVCAVKVGDGARLNISIAIVGIKIDFITMVFNNDPG